MFVGRIATGPRRAVRSLPPELMASLAGTVECPGSREQPAMKPAPKSIAAILALSLAAAASAQTLDLGVAKFTAGDYAGALRDLVPLAEQGSSTAMKTRLAPAIGLPNNSHRRTLSSPNRSRSSVSSRVTNTALDKMRDNDRFETNWKFAPQVNPSAGGHGSSVARRRQETPRRSVPTNSGRRLAV